MKKIILLLSLFVGLLPNIGEDNSVSLFSLIQEVKASDPIPTELFHCEDDLGFYESSLPCDFDAGTEACDICNAQKEYDEETDTFICPNASWCEVCQEMVHGDHQHSEDDDNDEGDDGDDGEGQVPGGGGQGHTPTTPQGDRLPISKQIRAIRDAYDAVLRNNGKGSYCNFGVQEAFKNAFGNSDNGIFGKTANQMVEYMRSDNSWHSIPLSEVNFWVNQGYFVVTGWYNPKGHGHVNVVLPGHTGSEFREVYVMDTGPYGGFDDPNSTKYGSKKQEYVGYYYYDSTGSN